MYKVPLGKRVTRGAAAACCRVLVVSLVRLVRVVWCPPVALAACVRGGPEPGGGGEGGGLCMIVSLCKGGERLCHDFLKKKFFEVGEES